MKDEMKNNVMPKSKLDNKRNGISNSSKEEISKLNFRGISIPIFVLTNSNINALYVYSVYDVTNQHSTDKHNEKYPDELNSYNLIIYII